MKQKDMYTLEDLYSNLDISLSKLSKIAGITEPTITRIRDGYAARRETINKLLKAFAQVYGIELSQENVTGITLEDKKALRKQMMSQRVGFREPENVEKPHVPIQIVNPTSAIESAQKRTYKLREADLPEGCILARDFAKAHGVAPETFRDHIVSGLGRGRKEREKVEASERPKAGRPRETERYLTQEQQEKALNFWQRCNVKYSQCEHSSCSCH